MTGIAIRHNLPTGVEAKRAIVAGYKKLRDLRIAKLLAMLVLYTPVDKGEARGGWRVTAGGPAREPEGTLDPDGSATIARGIASLEGIHHFANVYVSNPVPHMVFLEEGSSDQAPVGVIRVVLPAFKGMHGDVS
jgi:hypothetical protein